MSNPSKRKGTSWESAVVDYLRAQGWLYAERRALQGNLDRGDIAGLPGVCIEAKNAKTVTLGSWLDEAKTEARNDRADVGVCWFKRRGRTSAADGYVLLDGQTFVWLLKSAGYGGAPQDGAA